MLLKAQTEFTAAVGKLLVWAAEQGHQLTFGEAYRTPEQAALNAKSGIGIANSNHTRRLAVDLMLFENGVYQTGVEPYRVLGDYWKTLHPLARWGGSFHKPDADHFSFEWQGVQ